MVFWQQINYVSTCYIPTSAIAASRWGYSYRPSMFVFGCITARQWAILRWNPPRVLPILGVTTQVSESNKRFA